MVCDGVCYNFIGTQFLYPKICYIGNTNQKRGTNSMWNEENQPVQPDDIRREFAVALQERAKIAKTKKRKIIEVVKVILFVCAILVVFSLGTKQSGKIQAQERAYRGKLRNFATETMEYGFSNVFANLVSIEPKYFFSEYVNSRGSGVPLSSGYVCLCETVEGEQIWAYFEKEDYPESSQWQSGEQSYFGIIPIASFAFPTENPMKITGRVVNAAYFDSDLEDKIGDVFVLRVRETPEIPVK